MDTEETTSSLSDIEHSIHAIREDISSINVRTGRIESHLATLNGNVGRLERDGNRTDTSVRDLNTGIQQLDVRLSVAEGAAGIKDMFTQKQLASILVGQGSTTTRSWENYAKNGATAAQLIILIAILAKLSGAF